MKKQLFPALLFLLALPLSACGSISPEPEDDPTKVTIRVGTIDLGFGKEWLNRAAQRYMDLHKDDVFGDKKGVNVIVVPTTDTNYPRDSSLILSDNIDIHFRENVNFASLAKDGALMDIKDIMNEVSSYDGKTVISKLSDDDKALYTVNDKVYAAPFYSSSYGIIYNKQVFKEKKLYISATSPKDATDPTLVKFVATSGAKKSAGYNGVSGDYDDGLPSTYAEFEAVMKQAARQNLVPIAWSADYREQYLTFMTSSALMSDAGYEKAKLRFTFDGVADDLGTVIDGNFIKDSSSKRITNGRNGNGYELARSESVYNALSFLELITKDKNNYPAEDQSASGLNHYALQEIMVNGYTKMGEETKNVAMCIEGTWFENECGKHIAGYDELGMEFGFMPIPKKTFEGVSDRSYTYTDQASSCAFIKANIADENKKQVAKDFFKFFYSDNELVNFLKTTKAVVSVNYPTISKTSEDYEDFGSFGQSLYDLYKNAKRINFNFPNEFYTNNKNRVFDRFTFVTESTNNPVPNFIDGRSNAEAYFNDMANYFTKARWESLSD